MTITAFTKQNLQALRPELEAALAAVAAKHEIKLRVGNARFTGATADLKLELTVEGASKEAEAFRLNASSFYLGADDFGRPVTLGGKLFTIAGLRPRASARPICLAPGYVPNAPVTLPPRFNVASVRSVLKALGRDVPEWL